MIVSLGKFHCMCLIFFQVLIFFHYLTECLVKSMPLCFSFDYPNRKITLRRNKNYKDPFYYNQSGIVLQHNGVRVVKQQNKEIQRVETSYGTSNEGGGGEPTEQEETYAPFRFSNFFPAVISSIRENKTQSCAR